MTTYAGKCKGGPWDGQMMAHDAQIKEFFGPPMVSALTMNIENAEIITPKAGEYYWGLHGLWIWLPEGTVSRRKDSRIKRYGPPDDRIKRQGEA